ncbi:uncharacterized protein [Diabrotica undecimpunctata]|uniref:uncharacterized protein n=1 Tax=Diabrotica undecimpunctata TaxID=50387 RepID=UPI003B63FA5B
MFSDTSKKAYAAVVFLRVIRNDVVLMFLVAAKSRVAPLKKISISRLELLAAAIGVRLYQSVKGQFSQYVESYFWSDSTTVLSWIQRGRRTVQSILKECGMCKRQEGKSFEVQTPPLPADRVRDTTAFEIFGVGLTGPLYLKLVHLELVTSLSTNAFTQAFRRFVARRGRPRIVYSDNGTNFTGFENALKQLDWNTIAEYSSTQCIKWRFNPPTAAWWGEFWERLVGIVKGLLRKIVGRASLNYEDLLTLLCDCESIVISRPLTYLSDDPTELIALTPSMLLKEQLRDHLRKRFRAEYLAQLKAGTKKPKVSKVSIGDVVLVDNDNIKRLQWPLGKVIELIPGRDDQVKLVRLAIAQGQLLRPLQRLYLVEVVDTVTTGENVQGNTLPCGSQTIPDRLPQENVGRPQFEEKSS